jgi:septal ring factor EnvC (AmiA/AmiB activator)
MTERLDRIEQLLETVSTNQITTQNQLDSVTSHLDSVATHLDSVSLHLNSVASHLDSLVSTAADMRTRQIITQNQIDSLAALSTDTRQALMVLLQTSVRHEGRLDDLERGEDEPNP